MTGKEENKKKKISYTNDDIENDKIILFEYRIRYNLTLRMLGFTILKMLHKFGVVRMWNLVLAWSDYEIGSR